MPGSARRPQFGTRFDFSTAGEGVLRAAALLPVPPLLRERGVDPATVLTDVGLDPSTLDHPDRVISYADGGRVLQRCAEVTGCAHFGLLVGQRNTIASLGLLGEVMLSSANTQAALRTLILYMHLQTRGGVPTHSIEGSNATLGYAIYLSGMVRTTHAYDLAIAYEFNIMRALCGASWTPLEVSFSHNKPADLAPYRRFFAAPLRFDADRTAILFSKTWLEAVPPDSNVDVHRNWQRQIAVQGLREPESRSEQIRRALRTMVVSGGATESQISELLTIPARTLRRMLLAEGTTFRTLLEEVHLDVARQLLADSEMPTREIAATLGYSETSAFARAFRRWTNLPPATWREKYKAAEGRLGDAERAWRSEG